MRGLDARRWVAQHWRLHAVSLGDDRGLDGVGIGHRKGEQYRELRYYHPARGERARHNVSSLTSNEQVTIPTAIRDEPGLSPFDGIRFTIENGEVKLQKAYPSLDELVGILPAHRGETDLDDAIRRARDERAGELVDKLCNE
jgi:bifunctional DNA-binding transcriptional regulator/antitoxin component of YhaV-PrlF toxin-antitoxin module